MADPVKVAIPKAHEADPLAAAAIEGVILLAGPFGAQLDGAQLVGATGGVTIGFGLAAGAADTIGGEIGGGICTHGGRWALYGDVGLLAGALAGVAGLVTTTIVRGGFDAFGGDCVAFGLAGGEAVVGEAAVLLTPAMQFLGITVGVGVGAGLPLDVFAAQQRTWTTAPPIS